MLILKAINKNIIPEPRLFFYTLAINTTGHYPLKASDYSWELTMPKGLQEITGADEGRRVVRLEPTLCKQTEAVKVCPILK